MKKLFLFFLIFLSLDGFAQDIDYWYKPAKQELETNLSFGKECKIGMSHNRDYVWFNPKIKSYCTYISIEIPISYINVKSSIGFGTYDDVEIIINYKHPKFEINIGSSIMESFIIEFKINLHETT